MKVPRGDPPTNTSGSLHGWGNATVALMVESPPGIVAANPGVSTLTMPCGVTQLTTASNVPIGFAPNGTTIRPVTVTETSPWRSTEPLPDAMLHGAPPPRMPRSLTAPTAEPVIGVIESNWINLSPPPSAPTLVVPAPTRLRAPIPATRSFRQPAISNPPETKAGFGFGYSAGLPQGRRPKIELSST